LRSTWISSAAQGPKVRRLPAGGRRIRNSSTAPNQQRLASSEMSLIGRRRCDQSSRNLCLGSPVRQEVRVRRLGRATNSATAPCDRIPLADWVGGSSCLDARSAGSRFSARSVLLRLPVSTSLVQPLATAVAKGSTTIREAFEGLRRSGTATNDTAFANRRHRRAALFAAGNCQDTVGEPVRSGRNRWFVASPLEGSGFELVWGFSCQVVPFGLLPVLCSERKAVLRPVACDRVPGARGRGPGTETLA